MKALATIALAAPDPDCARIGLRRPATHLFDAAAPARLALFCGKISQRPEPAICLRARFPAIFPEEGQNA